MLTFKALVDNANALRRKVKKFLRKHRLLDASVSFSFFAAMSFILSGVALVAEQLEATLQQQVLGGSKSAWDTVSKLWDIGILYPLLAGVSLALGVALVINRARIYRWLGMLICQFLTAFACIWGGAFGFGIVAMFTPEGRNMMSAFGIVTLQIASIYFLLSVAAKHVVKDGVLSDPLWIRIPVACVAIFLLPIWLFANAP